MLIDLAVCQHKMGATVDRFGGEASAGPGVGPGAQDVDRIKSPQWLLLFSRGLTLAVRPELAAKTGAYSKVGFEGVLTPLCYKPNRISGLCVSMGCPFSLAANHNSSLSRNNERIKNLMKFCFSTEIFSYWHFIKFHI